MNYQYLSFPQYLLLSRPPSIEIVRSNTDVHIQLPYRASLTPTITILLRTPPEKPCTYFFHVDFNGI